MKYLGLVALIFCGVAYAQGPRIGLEYEAEKDNISGMRNDAFTIKPGWEFSKDSPINLVELLIDNNQDAGIGNNGFRAKGTKLFVRIRHGGDFNDSISYYLRGGVGRSKKNQRKFNYAYIEPGLKYKFNDKWEWVTAVREGDSIDGTNGQRVRKFLIGPSLSVDRKNEFEVRYIKGYIDKDVGSWQIGYTHRF